MNKQELLKQYLETIKERDIIHSDLTNLISASEKLIHLHMCEQEGIECGKPSIDEWINAVDNLYKFVEISKKHI